jgi:DNA-binding NarL/FixJ family response regulator
MRSVLVVYTHRARAEALGVAIDSQPDLVWAGAVENSEEAPGAMDGEPPHVAVIEGGHGPQLTHSIRTLRKAMPEVHIVVLTDSPEPATLADAAEAGAAAFVSDRDSLSNLLDAVRAAASGLLLLPTGTFTELVRVVSKPAPQADMPIRSDELETIGSGPGDAARPRAERHHPELIDLIDTAPGEMEWERERELEEAYRRSGLTPRERDVLLLLAQGLDAQGIAKDLFMSVHTARGHLKSIMMKMGVHSQLEVVVTAARAGLLPDFPAPLPAR